METNEGKGGRERILLSQTSVAVCMASGRAHTLATVVCGVTMTAYPPFGLSRSGIILSTAIAVFVQPDLDNWGGYIGDRIISSFPLIGRVFLLFWRAYWTPYRFFVGITNPKRKGWGDSHRAPLSHLPIVGTAIRLFWFWWPFYIFFRLVPPVELVMVLFVSDVVHSVMDSVRW